MCWVYNGDKGRLEWAKEERSKRGQTNCKKKFSLLPSRSFGLRDSRGNWPEISIEKKRVSRILCNVDRGVSLCETVCISTRCSHSEEFLGIFNISFALWLLLSNRFDSPVKKAGKTWKWRGAGIEGVDPEISIDVPLMCYLQTPSLSRSSSGPFCSRRESRI